MSNRPIIILIVLAALIAGTAQAQTRYGEALIEAGTLWVLRNETVNAHSAGPDPIAIQLNDLLRADIGAHLQLSIPDQATIEIGSGSVCLVQPWHIDQQTGLLKLLYGNSLITANPDTAVAFSVSTPSGAFTIEGSVRLQVDEAGNVLALVESGRLKTGRGEDIRRIDTGELMVAITGHPIIHLTSPPEDLLATIRADRLSDSARDVSTGFVGESVLIERGLIPAERLAASRQADITIDDHSFDVSLTPPAAKTIPPIEPGDPSAAVAAELEKPAQLPLFPIRPATPVLGVRFVIIEDQADPFSAYKRPKSPAQIIHLDDKTGWTMESGLITISLEK